jgi:hypothetical protein
MFKPLPQNKPASGSPLFAELGGTAVHGAVFSLLVLGVVGLIYKAFKPGGLVSQWLETFWHMHPGYAALMVVAILAGGFGLKRWLDATSLDGARGDVLIYAGLALGLFFGFQLIVTGSI